MHKLNNFLFIFFISIIACKDDISKSLPESVKLDENNLILAEDKYYKVNVSSLNLRKEPSVFSDILITLKKNRVIIRGNKTAKLDNINGVSGNWIYVSTLEETYGYVYEPFLKKAELETSNWEIETKNILTFCKKITYECLNNQSEYIYNTYDFIVKKGNSLSIVGLDGKIATFVDKVEYEDSIVFHRPLEIFFDDFRYVLIYVSYFEGNSYILFDRKYNKTTQLLDIPVLSPNKENLLVVSSSVTYNPSGVQIIKLTGREPVVVYEFKDKWRPCLGSWTSNFEVKIHECIEDYTFKENDGLLYSERKIEIIDNKWKLVP